MVSLLIVMAIFSLIFLAVGFLISRKIQTKETEDKQSNQLFAFFRYSILFITIIMMLGGGISIFMNVADYIAPSTYTQPYHEFKMYKKQELTKEELENTSEAEFKEMYDEKLQNDEKQMQKSALKGIVKSFGFIIIPFPIFYFFVRKRKE